MKILNLVQGSPEWAAHRAQHWNASDAPAMLGLHPNRRRADLMREVSTGVMQEFSDYVQDHVIAPGHIYEAKARELAEAIIGEELYPCVGVEGRYSASFDGLTLLGETAFEHKSLNEDLREAFADMETIAPQHREKASCRSLPEFYRVQMEQQCMVSGAEKVLFMASKWNGDVLEEKHECWYYPDQELRARIVTGWDQFEADLATYSPDQDQPAPTVVGRAPDVLPALRIEVTGMVTASNLAQWKESAVAVFRGIRTDLQTDQDFADAERTVKWCGEIEDQLKAAKQHALSQTASIDELFRTIDAIAEEARSKRLELNKLVTARKEVVRSEIVEQGRAAVLEHYRTINASLGEHALGVPVSLSADLGAAIKGKKSITSMQDAVNTVVVNAKITASQASERVRANAAILGEFAEHSSLFPDRVQLCASKSQEDLRNLVKARVAEHEQRERERLESERDRIRAEESDRLEREARAREQKVTASMSPTAAKPCDPNAGETTPIRPDANGRADGLPAVGGATSLQGQRIKLGDINGWIAPLSITADGLAMLGFRPVGTDRAAKLYAASDFPAICSAMGRVLSEATARAGSQLSSAA